MLIREYFDIEYNSGDFTDVFYLAFKFIVWVTIVDYLSRLDFVD